MLTTPSPNTPGLYRLWKIEKSIWLEGQSAMRKHVLPEAIIMPPPPMPMQRFEDLVRSAKDARPFESVDLTDREFLDLGRTVIICYKAEASHARFRRSYLAQCTTTYVARDEGWKIAAHTHVKL